jgi:hypothetical protein
MSWPPWLVAAANAPAVLLRGDRDVVGAQYGHDAAVHARLLVRGSDFEFRPDIIRQFGKVYFFR